MNRVLFSSLSVHWQTPVAVFDQLNAEFKFTLDPCPLHEGYLGLAMSWKGERVFCNPPYDRRFSDWLCKAREPELSIFLLPARTDTRWFHRYCLNEANEIRFIKGRLKFGEAKNSAPFPSMVVIFK